MNIFQRAYREIVNYFFLKKVILQQEKSSEWQIFNLRRDWIFRIYTVITLEQEFIDQVSGFEITQAIMDRMDPINKYLGRLNFGEIVAPVATRVEGTNSWLIVYNPLFRVLTFKNISITIGLVIASLIGYHYRIDITKLAKHFL